MMKRRNKQALIKTMIALIEVVVVVIIVYLLTSKGGA